MITPDMELPPRTPLSHVLATLTPAGDGLEGHVAADWMQGRTLYGGISAALCLAAARRLVPGLPALRSAQFGFVGPAAGDVRLTASVLRAGKSATFVAVDLVSEAGHGTRALLTFGAARDSAIRHDRYPKPDVPAPDDCPAYFGKGPRPIFARHFEVRLAGGSVPVSGASEADILIWLKPLDAGVEPPEALLLALADVPPPAAMALFKGPAMISTMSWMLDILAPGHVSPDPWFLMRSTAETAADGYSAQSMGLWAGDGTPLIAARQCVALFA